MSRGPTSIWRTCPGFPRVSGDEPRSYLNLEDLSGFSPRERGRAEDTPACRDACNVFPA